MKWLTRVVKGTIITGSGLFLAGAISYIVGGDVAGSYIYLSCAVCFLIGSILDCVDYEIGVHREAQVKPTSSTIPVRV
jgi:hypothetical protein